MNYSKNYLFILAASFSLLLLGVVLFFGIKPTQKITATPIVTENKPTLRPTVSPVVFLTITEDKAATKSGSKFLISVKAGPTKISALQVYLSTSYQDNTPPRVTLKPSTNALLKYLPNQIRSNPKTKSMIIGLAAYSTAGFTAPSETILGTITVQSDSPLALTFDEKLTKFIALAGAIQLPVQYLQN